MPKPGEPTSAATVSLLSGSTQPWCSHAQKSFRGGIDIRTLAPIGYHRAHGKGRGPTARGVRKSPASHPDVHAIVPYIVLVRSAIAAGSHITSAAQAEPHGLVPATAAHTSPSASTCSAEGSNDPEVAQFDTTGSNGTDITWCRC